MRRLSAVACLALLFAVPVFAADKKKKKKEPEPTVNVITAVNPDSVDLAMGTATKSVKVTQFTEIRVNGQKGSFADLRPGMIVSDLGLGADPSVASRLNVSGSAAPIETPAPEKKKRKKKEE